MTKTLLKRGGGSLLLLAVLATCPGCRRDEPGFEVMSLEGKIEKIELETGETGKITVLYYSEKHKQDVAGTGLVTKDTEIMINGAIAKLSDLRVGERVRGEVRVEKKGRVKTQVALKITVDRPKPVGTDEG
jgi:hypothetical protein